MGKAPTDGRNGEGRGQEDSNTRRAHDPSQQAATVHFPDSTKSIFYVSKKAEGNELFEKCVAHTGLNEKEYFALCFTDRDGNRHWIYDDKRISKQLKDHPWEFNFEVKFYPPEPASLNDDLTRHYLSLQVRQDISSGRLPATLATHALLGSYVAQSVCGDYVPSVQYIDFLRTCNLAPTPSDTLFEKVEEIHKQHKGKTAGEAEAHYLEEAKKLSMYGVHHFPAKDGKGVASQIGVCAHGINIYRDQLLVHRFLWQNIIKIAYRRNVFVIKVKPGELEKNETTISFKMPDQDAAKRVWKSAVEHHTFFRLVQPEEKPQKGLFRWGSAKFRYQGRTQFQSKIASQMNNNQPSVQRSESARLARENDGVEISLKKEAFTFDSSGNPPYKERTTAPINIKDSKQTAVKENVEVGTKRSAFTDGSARVMHEKSQTFPARNDISGGSAPSQATPLLSSSKASQESRTFSAKILTIPQSRTLRAEANGYQGSNTFSPAEHGTHTYTFQDQAVVYHPGHYEEEAAGGRKGAPREPPYEAGDDFVLIHRPKLTASGKIFHESGEETVLLIKEDEIETYPIRYYADVYHSDNKNYSGGNKNIASFEHTQWEGTEDIVSQKNIDKSKYPSGGDATPAMIDRMERADELPLEPIQKHSAIYDQGFYGSVTRRIESKKQQSATGHIEDIGKDGQEERDSKRVANDAFNVDKKRALVYIKQESGEDQTVRTINKRNGVTESSKGVKEIKSDTKWSTQVIEQALGSESEEIKPKVYGQPSTSFNNAVQTIKPEGELSKVLVTTNASESHSGPTISKSSQGRIDTERREGRDRSPSSSDEERDTEKHKHIARISLLSSQKKISAEGASLSANARDVDAPVSTLHRESELEKCRYTRLSERADTTKYKNEFKKPTDGVGLAEASDAMWQSADADNTKTAQKVVVEKTSSMQDELARGKDAGKTTGAMFHVHGYLKGDKEKLKGKTPVENLISTGTFQRIAHEGSPEEYILSRNTDIGYIPINSMTNALKYANSQALFQKKFRYATHGGEVEYVMKENVRPESYKITSCAYRGPVESMERTNELGFAPLQEHSAVYHPGYDYSSFERKSKKQRKMIGAPDENSGNTEQKKTALLYMKNDGMAKPKQSKEGELYKETKYTWKWRSDDKKKAKEGSDFTQKKRTFRYKRHKGDVEVVDKSLVNCDNYKLNTAPCGETAERLISVRELPFAPLNEHVAILPPTYYSKKRMRTRDSSSESSTSTSSRSSTASSSSSTVSEATVNKAELRTLESEISKQAPNKSTSVFSFWKKSGGKHALEKRKVPPKTPPKPSFATKQDASKDLTDVSLLSHETPRSVEPSTISLKGSEYEVTGDQRSSVSSRNENAKMQARLYVLQSRQEAESDTSKLGRGEMEGDALLGSGMTEANVPQKEAHIFGESAGDGPGHEANVENQMHKKKPAVPPKSATVLLQGGITSTEKKDASSTDTHTSPVAEVPYQPLRAKISIQHGQLDAFSGVKKDEAKSDVAAVDRPAEGKVAYNARVIASGTDKSAEHDVARSDSKKSPTHFKLKGVHLRGPPSDTLQMAGSKSCPENVNDGNQDVTVLSRSHEIADFALSGKAAPAATKEATGAEDSSKKIAALHIREEQLVAAQVNEPQHDRKKEEAKGGGFFSFLRGHKTKDGGSSRKQVTEKLPQDSALLNSYIDQTSPESEMQYKTLRAKIDVHDAGYGAGIVGSKSQKADAAISGKSADGAYVPVYDFSYIPIFDEEGIKTEEKKKAKALIRVRSDTRDDEHGERSARSGKTSVSGTFKRFFGRKTPKDNEEYYDALDQQPTEEGSKVTSITTTTFSSESSKKKSDQPLKATISDHKGGDARRNEASVREEVSSGRITDMPYQLSQASSNVLVSSTHQKTIGASQETNGTPEAITDVDQHGNVIKRTIKTQQVKQTVEKQTYQTSVEGRNGNRDLRTFETIQKSITPLGEHALTSSTAPVVETRSHTLAYESTRGAVDGNDGDYSDIPGELISSRTITQGNRTIETITYKTEKNGVIETHVEHRVTIHSGENIDHDAELNQAILEATNMNPDMTVEKIEVKQESQF